MLSISYTQAVADKSCCEAGIERGKHLWDGKHVSQPINLIELLPVLTVVDILWCLRAVKTSLKPEANNVAWRFIGSCLMQLDVFQSWYAGQDYLISRTHGSKPQYKLAALQDCIDSHIERSVNDQQIAAFKAVRAAMPNEYVTPSQIAIDVSQAVIKVMRYDGHEAREELRQRADLEVLLRL